MTERARYAVALMVPAPYRAEINGLRRALGDPLLDAIGPHITLVPPVNVAPADADSALDDIRARLNEHARLWVTIRGVSTFRPHTPVVYLSVLDDNGAIANLRESCRAGRFARPAPFAFVPHVTISGELSDERLDAAERALGRYEASFAVEHVDVLREHHEPGEDRRWQTWAEVPLGRRAVIGTGGLAVELSVTDHLDPHGADLDRDGWDHPRSSFAITARLGGEVVGIATGWTSATTGEAHLADLLVVAEQRGLGVGSHLLRAVEALARERACDRVTLRTDRGSDAEALYRRRGWVDESADWIQAHLVRYLA